MKFGAGFVVGCSLLAVAGGGCGSASDSPVELSEAQFPSEYARKYCEAIAPCCVAERITQDIDECVSALKQQLEFHLRTVDGASTTYHADVAGRCVAALRGELASCAASAVSPFASDVCPGMLTGKGELGSACGHSYQCASNWCNGRLCAVLPGAPRQGTLGQECDGDCYIGVTGETFCEGRSGSLCDNTAGLGCSGTGQSPGVRVCVQLPALGEPCDNGKCAGDTYCTTSGTCVERIALNAGPCTTDPYRCASGAYCDSLLDLCVARRPDGAACQDDYECKNISCRGHEVCAEPTAADSITCAGKWFP
jgi:hypothetical protein